MAASSSKLLLADLAGHLSSVPSKYIRPVSDRPGLTGMETSGEAIPVIDLTGLDGPLRPKIVAEIGMACRKAGFFQIKNHGIPEEVVSKMLCVSKDFFRLPESERVKNYSDDNSKTSRVSTSFNINTEEIGCWRDFLRLHCHPIQSFVNDWPSNPPSFKPATVDYSTNVRRLALRLLGAISESLGLDGGYMEKALGQQTQPMVVNYYPPCPQPELTYGLPGHKDSNAVTILLQEEGVKGLQVMREGRWVAVEPVAGALLVNVGDQIQVLSNGTYQSVLHRAVVSKDRDRVSVATFFSPSPEAVMEAAPELVDEEHPRLYRRFHFREYYDKFWESGLRTESCLEFFKEDN